MEHSYDKENKIGLSKETDNVMLNNLRKESTTIKYATIQDSFTFSDSEQGIERHNDLVLHTVLHIKEDEESGNFQNSNNLIIKAELVEDFEIENAPLDSLRNIYKNGDIELEAEVKSQTKKANMLKNITSDHSYCTVFDIDQYKHIVQFLNKTPQLGIESSAMWGTVFKEWTNKNEEINLKENVDFNEARSRDILHEDVKVKMENSETVSEIKATPEIVTTEWIIKNKEVDIKEEDSLREEVGVLSGGNNQEKQRYRCHVWDFQTNQNKHLKQTDPKENDFFRCNECEYRTVRKRNLRNHILKHHNPQKVGFIGCDKCEYRTVRKDHLKNHILQHRNPQKVGLFGCEYRTLYKSYLEEHYLKHKTPEEVKLFRCDKCDYQTRHNSRLKTHYLKHKTPEQIKKYRCGKCDFQTHYKSCLKIHCLKHKTPEEVKLFRCAKCDYQTRYKFYLKSHCLKHKNPEEVKLFGCDKCNFQTRYKLSFKRHYLKHKTPEEVKLFKCDECYYQTRYKSDLKSHYLKHKTPEEVKLFKCDKCSYQTRYKSYLKIHYLKHKTPEEVKLFRCGKCDYESHYIDSFIRHDLKHTSKTQVI